MLSNIIRYQKVIERELDLQLESFDLTVDDRPECRSHRAKLDYLAKERQDLESTFGGDLADYLKQVFQVTMESMEDMAPQMEEFIERMNDQ